MEILQRKGVKEVAAVWTRTSRIGLFPWGLLMTAGLLCVASCTHSVKADEADKLPPTLREIKVSGDGDDTRIEILGNKKLRYTLYNISAPPREVVDFPLTEAPLVRTTVPADSTLVTRVDIVKNETAGYPIARVIVKLSRPADFSASTDPSNEKLVVLTVKKPQASQAAASDGKKAGPARKISSPSKNKSKTRSASARAGAASSSKSAPVSSSGGSKNLSAKSTGPKPAGVTMTLEDVNITADGIEFDIKGVENNFTFFKTKNPQRLVIDILGAELGILPRQIAVDKFGIKNVRLGRHPDKVRIVLDPSHDPFPYCRIEVNKAGVKVLFKKEENMQAESSGG